jgi:hypothetical protein
MGKNSKQASLTKNTTSIILPNIIALKQTIRVFRLKRFLAFNCSKPPGIIYNWSETVTWTRTKAISLLWHVLLLLQSVFFLQYNSKVLKLLVCFHETEKWCTFQKLSKINNIEGQKQWYLISTLEVWLTNFKSHFLDFNRYEKFTFANQAF